jgi:hypothetical protein
MRPSINGAHSKPILLSANGTRVRSTSAAEPGILNRGIASAVVRCAAGGGSAITTVGPAVAAVVPSLHEAAVSADVRQALGPLPVDSVNGVGVPACTPPRRKRARGYSPTRRDADVASALGRMAVALRSSMENCASSTTAAEHSYDEALRAVDRCVSLNARRLD